MGQSAPSSHRAKAVHPPARHGPNDLVLDDGDDGAPMTSTQRSVATVVAARWWPPSWRRRQRRRRPTRRAAGHGLVRHRGLRRELGGLRALLAAAHGAVLRPHRHAHVPGRRGPGHRRVGRYDTRSVLLAVLVALWTAPARHLPVPPDARRRFRHPIRAAIKTDPLEFSPPGPCRACGCSSRSPRHWGRSPRPTTTALAWPVAVGVAIWLVGITIEATADHQKRAFQRRPGQRRGSSSPRDCGPGHAIPTTSVRSSCGSAWPSSALGALAGWRYVTLVSPLFVFVLLPMGQWRAAARARGRAAVGRRSRLRGLPRPHAASCFPAVPPTSVRR